MIFCISVSDTFWFQRYSFKVLKIRIWGDPWLVSRFCSYLLPKQALATHKQKRIKTWRTTGWISLYKNLATNWRVETEPGIIWLISDHTWRLGGINNKYDMRYRNKCFQQPCSSVPTLLSELPLLRYLSSSAIPTTQAITRRAPVMPRVSGHTPKKAIWIDMGEFLIVAY